MRSSKIWVSAVAIAFPLATWAESGCGGGGGSGGSGGVGGGTTSVTTGATTSGSTTGTSGVSSTSSSGTTTSSSSGTSTSSSSSSGATTSSSSSSSSTTGSTSSNSSSSSSSSTGSSSTGGLTYCPRSDAGTPPANHLCTTAEAHSLDVGKSFTITNGTTTGSTEDYPYCLNSCTGSSCAPPPIIAPNVVYAITLTSGGLFSATVTAAAGSSLLPTIDIRSDCAKPSLYCTESGTKTDTFVQSLAAGTYYFIVSGETCTAGAFTLNASLTAETCGDGVVEAGEDCDPGPNPPANDGCGAPGTANECKFIPAPAGEDVCPGRAVAVPAGTTKLLATAGYSTYGFADNYAPSAGCSQGPGGRDRVFQLTPAASGTLTVSIGYEADGVTSTCVNTNPLCWAHAIYARTTCANQASEIANAGATVGCVDSPTDPTAPSTLSFPVTANTPYFVFVDGYDDQNYSYGPFNLIINLK